LPKPKENVADHQDRFYSFTPEALNECVQTTVQQHGAKSNDTGAIITTLLEQLTAKYPDAGFQVDFRDTSEWVFNNAAGAMGSMYIIHASITE
jgi:C-8 sterol isomerase